MIINQLSKLDTLRAQFATNLADKGITTSTIEGLETMVPKVLDVGKNTEGVALSHFTAPAGRLAGDINGDGKIRGADVRAMNWLDIEDDSVYDNLSEYSKKLYDVNQNGAFNIQDVMFIQQASKGVQRYGKRTRDIDEKWLINPNYEIEKAQFYTDVKLENLTLISDLKIYTNKVNDILVRAEYVSDGILRLFVLRPPILDTTYDVAISKGTGVITVINPTKDIDIFSGVISASGGTVEIPLNKYYGQYIFSYLTGTDNTVQAPSRIVYGMKIFLVKDGTNSMAYLDANGSTITISEEYSAEKTPIIKISTTNNSGSDLYVAYKLYACDYNITEILAYGG